jgi:hypothetical protein
MRRTTIAIALATGALAVPAVSLAAGDGDSTTEQQAPSTAPVQQQDQQQQPRNDDCPEGQDGGSSGESGATSL